MSFLRVVALHSFSRSFSGPRSSASRSSHSCLRFCARASASTRSTSFPIRPPSLCYFSLPPCCVEFALLGLPLALRPSAIWLGAEAVLDRRRVLVAVSRIGNFPSFIRHSVIHRCVQYCLINLFHRLLRFRPQRLQLTVIDLIPYFQRYRLRSIIYLVDALHGWLPPHRSRSCQSHNLCFLYCRVPVPVLLPVPRSTVTPLLIWLGIASLGPFLFLLFSLDVQIYSFWYINHTFSA